MKRVFSFMRSHPKTALTILIAVTALIVYHRYFFGGFVFLFEEIGSDTTQQYISWYNSIARHLAQGDFSFWDATYGFGTPLYTLNLFHPTLGILYLVGAVFGGSFIAGALIYVHLLHLVLAGIGCYLFLSSFRLSRKAVFLFSYIYAFNGFIVMWGQHYHFAIFVFYLPLLLALIERSLAVFAKTSPFTGEEAEKRRKRALLLMPAVTGVMLLTGYYMSYMIALICLLYMILRFVLLKIRPAGTLLKAFFGRGFLLLLGAGIGCIYALPSYIALAEGSARLGGGSIIERILSAMSPWPKEYYMTFFKKLCSTGLEGIGITPEDYTGYGNIYEAPNIFLTGLFIILLVQFIIFLPKIAKTARARIVIIIALLAAAAICFVPAASLVFNGFAYPFSRHLFVLLPFAVLLSAFTLDYIIRNRCFSVIGALISILFTGFFCIRAIPKLGDTFLKLNAAAIFVTTFLMAFVLLLYIRRKNLRPAAVCAVLLALAAVQIISNTYTTVHRRTFISADSGYFEDVYGENDRALDEYLSENETQYYRLEKTFYAGSETMDALLQDYRGISGYNSTMNKHAVEFTDTVVPEFRTGTNPYWLTFRELGGRESLYPLFGIKYIVADEQSEVPEDYELAAVCGDTYLYEDPEVTFAHFYTKTMTEDAYENVIEATDPADGDGLLADYLILNDETDCDITDGTENIPDLASPLAGETNAEVQVPESENDGVIDIYTDSPEDGYLFVPVTCENGWEASVDGESVPILRADYCFMAVKVPAGTHSIHFQFTAPCLNIAIIITLISLAVYIIIIIIFMRKKHS